MNIKSKLTNFKSPLTIIIIVLLIFNVIQFYFIQNQKQQAKVNFFVQSRLTRDQNNSKVFATYKTIMDDINASAETKKLIENKFTNLIYNSNMEIKLETFLLGKGFQDCFIQLYDNKAIVFIKGNGKKIRPNNLKIIQAVILEAANIKDVEIIQKN